MLWVIIMVESYIFVFVCVLNKSYYLDNGVSTVSLFQRDTNVDFPCVHKWGPVTSEKAAYCIGTPCQDEITLQVSKGESRQHILYERRIYSLLRISSGWPMKFKIIQKKCNLMVALIGRECLIREPTKVTDVPNTLIFYMGTFCIVYKMESSWQQRNF